MLGQRVLSAAILIPLAALLAYLGGWWFFVAIAAILLMALYEFYQLTIAGGYHPATALGILFGLGLLLTARFPQMSLTEPLMATALVLSLIWHLVAYERKLTDTPTNDWALTIAGALYLGWMGHLFLRLRDMPNGLWWILLACVPIWVGDTGAYLVGVKWGQHKCCPRLSPKKSWEGTVAGWLTGTLSTVVIWLLIGLPLVQGLILGLLLSVITPLGDLAESMFKRQVGVKDSGNLIPGHGGALDRMDSLLFSVPIVFYYVTYFVV